MALSIGTYCNEYKVPEVTITELSSSPSSSSSSSSSKWSKKAPSSFDASVEHNEIAPLPETRRKAGFVNFFKNLSGSGKVSNRVRSQASRMLQPSSKPRLPQTAQQFNSVDVNHARVEALMGKPKKDTKIRDQAAELPAYFQSQSNRRPLTKSELHAMFLGAPVFGVAQSEERHRANIENFGNTNEIHLADAKDGTVSFDQFLESESTSAVGYTIVERVLGNSRGKPNLVPDQNAPTSLGLKELPVPKSCVEGMAKMNLQSHPFGSQPWASVHDDFSIPVDGLPVFGNEVKFAGLSYSADTASLDNTPILTFISPINSKLPAADIPLSYNAQFVSSHPCYPTVPKPRCKPRAQGTDGGWGDCLPSDFLSPEHEDSDSDSSPPDSACSFSEPPSYSYVLSGSAIPAHPLHNDYHHDVIPVALLLSMPELVEASLAPTTTNESVIVLDCRGSEDLELLARAWCAKIGEHAVVSKVAQTCLACSVREARALAIRIVIRVSDV